MTRIGSLRHGALTIVSFGLLSHFAAAQSFVNWENPHVSPLDMTPDGSLLLAVNTPDNRLELFDLTSGTPVWTASVQVGLDPVSVRARTNGEAWVVNHISDTLSIVDLVTGHVTATVPTGDEPTDVIFAGTPERAFVSISQENRLQVFLTANPAAPPLSVPIEGEDPRALAKSPAGDQVYVAVFESGNQSTLLAGGTLIAPVFPPQVVNDPAGPYGGVNPPPNDGASFDPPLNPALPTPPQVALIVKRDGGGAWRDDNGTDWSSFIDGAQASSSGRPTGWTLIDHDVAIVDTAALTVTYAEHLMNANMALGVHPVSGDVHVVGTDGTNEIRYEPLLNGVFVRVLGAAFDPALPGSPAIVDLNGHLDYLSSTVAQTERDKSIGDPRGLAWNQAGTKAYVTGMGSNNVIVLDPTGTRVGLADTIEVGEGPTGIVCDDARDQLYVLNKFDSSVSVVSTTTELETARISIFDPSPAAIQVGRKHLYGTHETSGLGQASCASCHLDSRMDRLAWDLGDPSGDMKSVADQNLGANVPGLNTGFEDFHPMKGPMTTQTLQDIIGLEPHHWRGDRDGIEEFNPAFEGLLGDDTELTPTEMQEFEDFLATIFYPPNPYRNFDNTLPTDLPLPGHFTTGRHSAAGLPLPNGDAVRGMQLFRPPNFRDGGLACVTCHTLPTGVGTNAERSGVAFVQIPQGPNGEFHHALVSSDGQSNVSMKIPHLRNQYDKVGMNMHHTTSLAGFGFAHDGSVDSVERFIDEPLFDVNNDQELADFTAFMLAFSGSDLPMGSGQLFIPPGSASQDSHAAVGRQLTLRSAPGAGEEALLDDALAMAEADEVGLVAVARRDGLVRGFAYVGGGRFQSDRHYEFQSAASLSAGAAVGSEVTFTVVPEGSELRIGIDRDEDGFFDRDELDAASDPADPASTPSPCLLTTPNAPTGLAVLTVLGGVQLSWTDASSDEARFVVERRAPGDSFVFVGETGPGVESFLDVPPGCGTRYDYRVLANNCAGSGASAELPGRAPFCEGDVQGPPRPRKL